MYLVSIEPIYSQGVGHFELITDNPKYVLIFLNELNRYKEYLKNNDENIDEWEFCSTVHKLVDFIDCTSKCYGHCIWKSYCVGNGDGDRDRDGDKDGDGDGDGNGNEIEWNKKLLSNDELEVFEYSNISYKNNYVYNFFDDLTKPIYIDNFDIIGKNYLK